MFSALTFRVIVSSRAIMGRFQKRSGFLWTKMLAINLIIVNFISIVESFASLDFILLMKVANLKIGELLLDINIFVHFGNSYLLKKTGTFVL